MDLDEVADRLYALPPPEFTAARTAEARAAKDAGDARLAREIAKLRKPTVSAAAINRVARAHPGEVAELLEVGERLRAAWQEQDPGALAELTRRRGEVTGRLGRLVRQEGELSGAAAAEVEQTLDAAVVDAGAAEQVRRGRLARPLAYSGFAPAPTPRERPVKKTRPGEQAGGKKKPAPEQGQRAGGKRKPAPEDEAAAARTREEDEATAARTREEEEAAAARAREEAAAAKARERAEAEAAHREWQEAVESAQRDFDERAAKVERLERKLAKARAGLDDSGHRLEVARREERHARRRLDQ
ncbi:hypothetical protein SMD20_04325 [Nonomuraea sp. LP-02]|uniref:hypothetical protein n=1 Tax=Nonomuraea sp. LP-02 TaxID=3097960 RepID=UPI002E2EA8E2|nr:hypothetical protein [Nonomuraea sp. LP-02]MED7923439.1 hypothetical protein [Nonomuraea sp. LP-02]